MVIKQSKCKHFYKNVWMYDTKLSHRKDGKDIHLASSKWGEEKGDHLLLCFMLQLFIRQMQWLVDFPLSQPIIIYFDTGQSSHRIVSECSTTYLYFGANGF